MPKRPLSAIVLAAGEGTRMRSSLPKPLHRLCGRPMIRYVLDALVELPVGRVVVVVGHSGERVTKALVEGAPPSLAMDFVEQPSRRGTADALAVALTSLPPELGDLDGDVLVLPGDTPLVRPQTLAALVRRHRETEAAATLLTARVDRPDGTDRVLRDPRDGNVVRVVEDADVVGDEHAIEEIATTIHCFRHGVLAPALRRLHPLAGSGEHSLTGVYAVLHDAGYKLESFEAADKTEAAGVNDKAQLAFAEAELRDRINDRWMRHGVTMWDPERTYVDADAKLEPEVVLLPGVVIEGTSVVRSGAEIGPDCQLVDSVIGERAVVRYATVTRAEVGARARVGPFAVVGEGVVVDPGAVVPPGSNLVHERRSAPRS